MTTSPENFTCDLCREEFDSASELQSHKQDHLRPAKTQDEDDRDIRRDIGAPGLPTSPVT
jgi:hypothetical protein